MNRAYRRYLDSPEWEKLKKKILKRDKKRCCHRYFFFFFRCKKTTGLHVHHKTYKRVKTIKGEVVGKERRRDLITLCSKHHNHAHKRFTFFEKVSIWAQIVALISFMAFCLIKCAFQID